MKKFKTKQNYGFGRTLKYAANNALRQHYGDGRYATRATVISKCGGFFEYLKSQQIYDFRKVNQSIVRAYARSVQQEVESRLCSATGQGKLSAVNQLMLALTGSREYWVSPVTFVGRRSQVRNKVPLGLDTEKFERVITRPELPPEIKIVVRLCRQFGLRIREATLLRVSSARREAKLKGSFLLFRGCKGGRMREVAVDAKGLALLEEIHSELGRDCVIPEGWNYVQFSRFAYHAWNPVAKKWGLSTGFHDLRAAFGCAAYTEITGVDAPVLSGGVQSSRDIEARTHVATVLGHGRIQIAAAYVGTKRPLKQEEGRGREDGESTIGRGCG